MNDRNIFEDRNEEIRFWLSFGYVEDGVIYCQLCMDVHQNKATCQRND